MSEQTQNNLTMIGIDVSKDKLDIYSEDVGTHSVINNQVAIRRYIKALPFMQTDVLFVMESTGGYEKLVRNMLNQAGYQVHIAHPTRINHFAKQKGYFAKTDAIDAKIIFQYGTQENVQPTPQPPKQIIELKDLSSRRAQLIESMAAEKCRLQAPKSPEIKRSIKRHIKYFESEIKLLDDKIAKQIADNEEINKKAKRIQTVKGLGEKTANALVSLLPELGSLNRAEIACLCGVAPKNNDSGTKSGKRMVSGGRFYVRKALYMPALCACFHNPVMRTYYKNLINKGKAAKVAITAVIRKIIITLNAMIRDDKDWCYKEN